jgi:hypothetical protein
MRAARAKQYREEAARLRDEATRAKHPEIRQQLLDIAAQYDRLANSVEDLLRSNCDIAGFARVSVRSVPPIASW